MTTATKKSVTKTTGVLKSEPEKPENAQFKTKELEKPKIGNLCLIALPNDNIEPLAVGRYLGTNEDNQIIVQWFGSNTNIEDAEVRICKQNWLPGWYQPSDTRFYWKKRKIHRSHSEFTNLHTDHVIEFGNIIMTNLTLRMDDRIPKDLALVALRAWHLWKLI